MSDERIGRLFPAGGPVPPELVIGRTGDIDEIARRLREAGMLGAPVQFGKLVDRFSLDPRISLPIWRESLPERFGQAGMTIEPEALDALLSFGDGKPYATMAAARCAALNVRKLGSGAVGRFEAEEGVAEARRHLEDDG